MRSLTIQMPSVCQVCRSDTVRCLNVIAPIRPKSAQHHSFTTSNNMNSKTLTTHARVQSCRKSRHIQGGISRQTQQIRRPSVAPARFMRSRDDDVGGKTVLGSTEAPNSSIDLMDMFHNNKSLDEALQGTMSTMSENARESLGWLKHAFQDPDDFSASAIGRMVSKEYGRHERPHTEHHMKRSGASTSPGGSPTAEQAAAAAAAASTTAGPPAWQGFSSPQHGTAPQQQQGARWGWGWGLGIPASSTREEESGVYHSPPSGPGFLLQQQKQQEQGPAHTR